MEFAKEKETYANNLNENGNIFINNQKSSFNRDLFCKTRMFAKANFNLDLYGLIIQNYLLSTKNENHGSCITQDDHDLYLNLN